MLEFLLCPSSIRLIKFFEFRVAPFNVQCCIFFFGIVYELFVSVVFVTHWKSFDHIFTESICFSLIITYKIDKILQLFVLQCIVYVEYSTLNICLCVKYFEKHLHEKHLFQLYSAERCSSLTHFSWLFLRFIISFFLLLCLPLLLFYYRNYHCHKQFEFGPIQE